MAMTEEARKRMLAAIHSPAARRKASRTRRRNLLAKKRAGALPNVAAASTPEVRAKAVATYKRNRAAGLHGRPGTKPKRKYVRRQNGAGDPASLPVVNVSRSAQDAAEFASFMATAWKAFKEQQR